MKWFRRRRERDLPPLFRPPKADEPIVLDEEESKIAGQMTTGSLGRVVQTIERKGRRFPEPIKGELEDFITVETLVRLLDLARSRLGAGDYSSAARTCVKVIGIGGTLNNPKIFAVQEAWLLLAEIHAAYGDLQRYRSFLQTANEKENEEIERLRQQDSESQGIHLVYEEEWKARVAELQRRFN